MDLRTLQSMQEAAPVLLRHLGSYLELAEQDLVAVKNETVSQLRFLALCAISSLFALLFICAFVIALTWDGPNRLLAIGLMAGGFTLLAIFSALYLQRKKPNEPFAAVKREWREDREIVYRLLSPSA